MCTSYKTGMTLALVAAMLLVGCGQAPGVAVESSSTPSTAAGGITEADAEATVQARLASAGGLTEADVEATVEARLAEAQASVAPSAAGGLSEADLEATVEARVDQALASAAPSSLPGAAASSSPVASPSAASAAASTAATASQAPAPLTGETEVILAGQNSSLTQLNGGAWSTFQLDASSCRTGEAESFFDPDGTPIISCGYSVLKADNSGEWERLNEELEHSGRAFLAPDGRLWLVRSDGILVRDGEQWTSYEPQETIQAESFPTEAVAFAPDGKVYFGGVSPDRDAQLVMFDGASWRNYGNLTEGNDVMSLLYTSKGELLVGTNGALFRLNGDALEPVITSDQFFAISSTGSGVIGKIVETPDGTIWLATWSGAVSWNGSEAKFEGIAEGLPALRINDLDVDESGNLWAATTYGIAVRRDGRWQAAVLATSGLGDSNISTIATRGTPQLPPAEATPKTAMITGRVTIKNVPVANRQVELCSERIRTRFSFDEPLTELETPCMNMFFHQLAPTDAEGVYRFENIPIGTYSLAVQNQEGQWISLIGGIEVEALTPGKTYQQDAPIN